MDSASADNLGNEPPRLIPFAHLVVQMRNRAYMPQLGRFLQPDPNATALTLIEATSFHGRGMGGMGALVAAFDVQGLYGDGMNLYAYLGSNPWMRADPLGLFGLRPSSDGIEEESYWDRTVEGVEMGINAAATFASFSDVGGLTGSMAQSLLENYSENQDADADWAMDWSMSDNWHSRNSSDWVQEAMLVGAYRHFNLDPWMGSGGGDGPAMAGMLQQTIRVGGKIVRKGHLHHALPRFLVKYFKNVKEVVGRMPVRLHQKWHKGHDTLLQKNGFPPMNQRAAFERYMKEGGKAAREKVKRLTRAYNRKFEKDNKVEGLADAFEESFP
ncbi:MAG: hypothetical protein KF743_14165 [Fimbriimonadaceae bacterium]|nr:hypothetical protein [Fimbriimonadaceae bacterium]